MSNSKEILIDSTREKIEKAHTMWLAGKGREKIADVLGVSIYYLEMLLEHFMKGKAVFLEEGKRKEIQLLNKITNPEISWMGHGKQEPYHDNEMDYGTMPNYKLQECSQEEKDFYFEKEKELKNFVDIPIDQEAKEIRVQFTWGLEQN